ncbi:site-specific integrase [Nocardioides sp. WL0053]|uniref:Site-specific integrase n=1 Tax=Nocardioides jiangsuensis TaxID=2866161 RepID=A0ABS7RHG6_9ACTN|nr:site-specific integrase [Nocardioides jiangsuensis]MBY9074216.1 site-specific integrase [Nocardioides jiangsuensis]
MNTTPTNPAGSCDDGQLDTPRPTGADGTTTAVTRALTESIDTVKQLLAAGLLDATALGIDPGATRVAAGPPDVATDDAARQGSLPTWFLVPGEPIKIRDLMEKTRRGLTVDTRRAYGSYLDFLANGWSTTEPGQPTVQHYPGLGDRWAHEVLPTDLEEALRFVEQRALETGARRAAVREAVGRTPIASTGVGAQYNAVGAWRRAFAVAVKDRHLARQFNPAKEVTKPRRITGKRRPLTQSQTNEFWAVIRNTGNDPELDEMLCLTIIVAGARREGLFNLTLGGLDRTECTVRLDEKFGKVVDQPVPDWLVDLLHEFAVSRGASRNSDPVFRTRPKGTMPGRPITDRRLDNIFQRLQSLLPWADKNQVTAHTLRHHAIALIERGSSKAVATEFARHEPEDTNGLYGRASAKEVAQAVIRVHGGGHPWVNRDDEELA